MGCWKETCALTNLPIAHGDDVIMILLKKNRYSSGNNCHYDKNYIPFFMPIRGTYNDYGGIKNIKNKKNIDKELANYDFYEEFYDESNSDPIYQEVKAYDLLSIQALAIKNHLFVDIYGKSKVAIWMCHEGAYHAVVKDIFAREDPDFEKKRIRKNISDIKKAISIGFSCLKSKGFGWEDDLDSCIDYGKRRISIDKLSIDSMHGYDPTDYYIQKMAKEENEDYMDTLIEYLCFIKGITLLRKGFFTQSGSGSQDYELHLHEVLAKWILFFIHEKHKKFEEECDYDLEDNYEYGMEDIY